MNTGSPLAKRIYVDFPAMTFIRQLYSKGQKSKAQVGETRSSWRTTNSKSLRWSQWPSVSEAYQTKSDTSLRHNQPPARVASESLDPSRIRRPCHSLHFQNSGALGWRDDVLCLRNQLTNAVPKKKFGRSLRGQTWWLSIRISKCSQELIPVGNKIDVSTMSWF